MKLTSEEQVIAGLAIGAATAGSLLSEDEGVTVPTIFYVGPHNGAKSHLTAVNFTLGGMPFPAVFDSGNTTATNISYKLAKAARSELYPIIHTPNDDLHPNEELRLMPFGIFGSDVEINTTIIYTKDNSPNDNLVPLEAFTPCFSVLLS